MFLDLRALSPEYIDLTAQKPLNKFNVFEAGAKKHQPLLAVSLKRMVICLCAWANSHDSSFNSIAVKQTKALIQESETML